MPTITLYVKEADQKIIEKAKAKLGDSLSSVFADCVRERMDDVSHNRKEHKITLTFWNSDEQPVIKKSFTGTWLVGNESEGMGAESDDPGVSWGHGVEYSVALSRQGKLVIYERD